MMIVQRLQKQHTPIFFNMATFRQREYAIIIIIIIIISLYYNIKILQY
jgi:prolipoprotein diacylglyceryltransferase